MTSVSQIFESIFQRLQIITAGGYIDSLEKKFDKSTIKSVRSNLKTGFNPEDIVSYLNFLRSKIEAVDNSLDRICMNISSIEIESLFPPPILYDPFSEELEYVPCENYPDVKTAKEVYNKQFDSYYESLIEFQNEKKESFSNELKLMSEFIDELIAEEQQKGNFNDPGRKRLNEFAKKEAQNKESIRELIANELSPLEGHLANSLLFNSIVTEVNHLANHCEIPKELNSVVTKDITQKDLMYLFYSLYHRLYNLNRGFNLDWARYLVNKFILLKNWEPETLVKKISESKKSSNKSK